MVFGITGFRAKPEREWMKALMVPLAEINPGKGDRNDSDCGQTDGLRLDSVDLCHAIKAFVIRIKGAKLGLAHPGDGERILKVQMVPSIQIESLKIGLTTGQLQAGEGQQGIEASPDLAGRDAGRVDAECALDISGSDNDGP